MIYPRLAAVLLVALSLAASSAAAQIYSWVDEQGKTHYGDRVPQKYQSKGDAITLSPHNSVDLGTSALPPTPARRASHSPKRASSYSKPTQQKGKRKQAKSACEAQKQAYKMSKACFSQCRMHGGGINKAMCTSCRDMKRPSC